MAAAALHLASGALLPRAGLDELLSPLALLASSLTLAPLLLLRPSPAVRALFALGSAAAEAWLLWSLSSHASLDHPSVTVDLVALSALTLSLCAQASARSLRGLFPSPGSLSRWLLGLSLALAAVAAFVAFVKEKQGLSFGASALSPYGGPIDGDELDRLLTLSLARLGEARAVARVALSVLVFPMGTALWLSRSGRPSRAASPPAVVAALAALSTLSVVLSHASESHDRYAEAEPEASLAALARAARPVREGASDRASCRRLAHFALASGESALSSVGDLPALGARCLEEPLSSLERDPELVRRHQAELLSAFPGPGPVDRRDPSPFAEPSRADTAPSQAIEALERSPLLLDPGQRARVERLREKLGGAGR